jgi:hypothetical protein
VWIGAVGFADELRLDGVLGSLIMPLSARDAMLGRDIRTEISGSGVRYGGMRGTRRDAQPTARFTVVGLVDNSQHARNSLERPGR